jgi:cell division protein FtsB
MVLRALKHRLRALAPPAIFLAITYYFGWNAIHGKSGLEAQQQQRAELAQVQHSFNAVDAQRVQWETRINDLSAQAIDPDMLDGQARQILNLANPGDLVIETTHVKPGE